MREFLTELLLWGGWLSGVVGWLKYAFVADETGPIHFVAFGCWCFLGALVLRRAPSVSASGDSNG